MSKFERVFYVFVILAMFVLVILFQLRLRKPANCSHCLSMLQDLQTFNPENKLPENVFIYLFPVGAHVTRP